MGLKNQKLEIFEKNWDSKGRKCGFGQILRFLQRLCSRKWPYNHTDYTRPLYLVGSWQVFGPILSFSTCFHIQILPLDDLTIFEFLNVSALLTENNSSDRKSLVAIVKTYPENVHKVSLDERSRAQVFQN